MSVNLLHGVFSSLRIGVPSSISPFYAIWGASRIVITLTSLHGWAGQIVVGTFTGGLLVFPDMGVKIQMEPGDVLFFKPALLEHYVEDYTGSRPSIVLFTQDSVYSSDSEQQK